MVRELTEREREGGGERERGEREREREKPYYAGHTLRTDLGISGRLC